MVTDGIDVMRQMCAAVCGGADDAPGPLESGNVWEAREILQKALSRSGARYPAAEQAAGGLEALRGR